MRSGDEFDASVYEKMAGDLVALASDVIRPLKLKPADEVLDVGCGAGVVTEYLSKKAKVTGIDVSAGMIEEAKKKGLNVSVQDATNLQFPDNSFDKIFSNAVIHWISDREKLFSELFRVMKDGGVMSLAFGGECPPGIKEAVVSAAKDFGYDVADKDPFFNTDIEKLEEILKKNGFTDIDIKLKPKLQTLPKGMRAWLEEFVKNTFYKEIPADIREQVMDLAVQKAEKYPNYFSVGENPEWFADYQRVCVTGTKNKEKARVLGEYTNQTEAGVRGLNN